MLFLSYKPLAGTRLDRLAGYLYVPYQALQLTGYYLVGSRCRYRWGCYGLQPVDYLTPRQIIIGTAFPTLILGLMALIQFAGSVYLALAYAPQTPWLLLPLAIQPAFPISLFVSFIMLDMLRLRRLLKASSQPAYSSD